MQTKWWTLLVVCVTMFMLLLDVTVVTVAIAEIQRSLGADFEHLRWTIDAYALMLAVCMLTAGTTADIIGRRKVMIIGLAAFTLASLACGAARSPEFLIAARAVQGIGGSMLFATSLALLAQEFSGRERGVAFGIWGAVTGMAIAVGPIIGGVVTQKLGWEWIFYINVPVGIIAIIIARFRLRESRDPSGRGFDLPGVATFTLALFMFVLALMRASDYGWAGDRTLAMLGIGAAALIAFIFVERRVAHPMMDFTMFRNRSFVGVSATAMLLSASIFAMLLYLALYLQIVLNMTPIQAGLRFLPISLLTFVVAAISGSVTARVPPAALLGGGMACISAGLAMMSGIVETSTWYDLLAGMLVAGVGIGLVSPALASTAIAVAPTTHSGMASGMNSTFRQLGLACGVAALGAIFQLRAESRVFHDTRRALTDMPVALAHRVADLVAHGHVFEAMALGNDRERGLVILHAARRGFVDGMNDILVVAAVLAALGAVAAVLLVRGADLVHAEDAPA